MENSIKELVREYKSKMLLEGKNSLNINSKEKRDEIIKASNPILRIMNKVESEVIKIYEPTIRELSLYSVNKKPVSSSVGYNSIDRMKITDDLVKIVSVHYACGDSWFSTVKIPLSYFDMTEDEIIETHTKWSKNRLESDIEKNKTQLIKRKKVEMEKLKEEIKKLSK